MAVLVCLGRHAPGVVTKERLLEEVWSDSPFVGDDVISHAIWELRKALGDPARDPAYIRTVPRKGYQLMAEILRPQGSPLPMAGVRIDHYDLKEELGRGAMGVVYQAADRRLGRAVAIKFLAPELTRDPEACRRFEREARLAASLEHPNLATVHEIGETTGGHRYLVGAYYRGGSLKDRLAADPIEVPEALALVRQLLAGLGAAHARDIVHRDVKPANLLLDDHGTLKICDFGIAKLLGATDLTRTGTPLGTPAYKSPEQTQGQPIDHRTDLWSAGVVLFELLTGRRPFGGEEHAVVHSILSRQPQVLEDAHGRPVPEPLRRVVARALAKDPAERFQSAEEMTAALDGLDAGSTVLLRSGGRRRWLAAGAAVLVALLAFWALRSWQPASPDTAAETAPDRELSERLGDGRRLWLRGHHPENLDAVREHFETAVLQWPFSMEAKEHFAAFLADRYFVDGGEADGDQARELVRQILSVEPLSARARSARARILLKESKLRDRAGGARSDKLIAEAELLARDAIAVEPSCAQDELCDLAYLARADALRMQDRTTQALAILSRGVVEGGGRIRCRLRMALFYDRLGESDKAEDEYEVILEVIDPMQTTALLELSVLLMKAERYKEAVPRLEALHALTGDPRTLNNLGMALYGLARIGRVPWDKVVSTYERAHAGFEAAGIPMPTPLVAIGDAYLEQGLDEEARDWFQQALVKFEAMTDQGRMRRGQRAACLAKLGRFAEAEAAIERLLVGVEDTSFTLVHAARVYALKGDRDSLFELARRWQRAGQDSTRFLDDAAFIRYRQDLEYLRILEPQLIPAE